MRRSVICHTNDVDTKNDSEIDFNNNIISHKQQQKQQTNNYSIQHLLSTKRNDNEDDRWNYQQHKIRDMESKDSGFEDDDDTGKSSEGSEQMDVNDEYSDDVGRTTSHIPKLSFHTQQDISNIPAAKTGMPELIHKSKSPTFPIEIYSTYSTPETNEFCSQVMNQSNIAADDNLKNLQLMDPNSAQFKRRFESSVLSALRDPQIQYLLTLYSFVDERLLRNTLLKFLRGSSLDTDTLHAAEHYLKKSNTSKDEISESTTNLNESSLSKTDALFDFISQSRQQLKFLSTPRTEREIKRTDDQQMERDRFLLQSGTNNLLGTNYENRTVKPTAEASCEYCQKTFSTQQSLTRHLRTHEGKRSHKCSQCSRSFYDQASYMRHVRSHSGDKKHKCEQCSMAFNKRSALEVHIRTHTGERPFVCKYCGKGFSISGNLHRHVLIHTGHRPYKCGKCPRAFNNPSHLARHINSFHT